jgi:hypothetical protein
LETIESTCLRNLIGPYLDCYLTADLSCNRNGEVQGEGCPALGLEQLSQCGLTVTVMPTDQQPGSGGGSGTRVDGGR